MNRISRINFVLFAALFMACGSQIETNAVVKPGEALVKDSFTTALTKQPVANENNRAGNVVGLGNLPQEVIEDVFGYDHLEYTGGNLHRENSSANAGNYQCPSCANSSYATCCVPYGSHTGEAGTFSGGQDCMGTMGTIDYNGYCTIGGYL